MIKKAFTLIELIIVLAIIAILFMSVWVNLPPKTQQPVFAGQVIRKYDIQQSNNYNHHLITVLHIDVKRRDSNVIEPMTTESYDVFANLIENNWYNFNVVGVRDEKWNHFPIIVSVEEIK